nr:electron transfer flavoprotein regulatory factor 1 [Bubalus bubalis]
MCNRCRLDSFATKGKTQGCGFNGSNIAALVNFLTLMVLCLKMANPLRGEVLNLYKNLLYLGRDYPKGADYFKRRLKNVFLKNKDVKDPEKIKELIERGKFVMKELEALYFLRKYRAMKQRYYSDTNKTK